MNRKFLRDLPAYIVIGILASLIAGRIVPHELSLLRQILGGVVLGSGMGAALFAMGARMPWSQDKSNEDKS